MASLEVDDSSLGAGSLVGDPFGGSLVRHLVVASVALHVAVHSYDDVLGLDSAKKIINFYV